jgi:two-component system OmpR family response regulator
MGGDDYVTKPFSPRELIARIKVILKRSKKCETRADHEQAQLQHGLLLIDTDRREVSFDQKMLELTAREFGLLLAFCKRPGMVFTRDQLMDAAYDHSIFVSDRTIDSHIRNIRAKMVSVHCLDGIETVHGYGFRLGKCERGNTSK